MARTRIRLMWSLALPPGRWTCHGSGPYMRLPALAAWPGSATPNPVSQGPIFRRDWLVRALRQYGVEAVQDVSINRTWSALQLGPAKDDHQLDSSTALGDEWG